MSQEKETKKPAKKTDTSSDEFTFDFTLEKKSEIIPSQKYSKKGNSTPKKLAHSIASDLYIKIMTTQFSFSYIKK